MSASEAHAEARARFRDLVAEVTRQVAGRPLDSELQADLNHRIAPSSTQYAALFAACREAVAAGWMCSREAAGIRYGRVIKPEPAIDGFSVDVVEMDRIRGPHHLHPNGEIDLVMPLEGPATFDGQGAGWKVYGPGTAHYPTVSGGRALVLYLLPQGAIEFTPGSDEVAAS